MKPLSIAFAAFFAASPAFAQYLLTTVAGGGGHLTTADNGAQATNLPISMVWGLATDADGNVYAAIGGSDSLILKITPSGVLSILAGQPGAPAGFSGQGSPAVNAKLSIPNEVAVDAAGRVYFADTSNNRVRRIDPDGNIWTVAGSGQGLYSGDGGPAVYAGLWQPQGVAADAAGNVYIADTWNCRVRKVDVNGVISTFAGTGQCGFSGDGGPASAAMLNDVSGVLLDPAGNLYLDDYGNQRIRKVDATGKITTIAGNGSATASGDGGQAVNAGLGWIGQIALDAAGNFYLPTECCVRKISGDGTINTIAGNGGAGYSGDGGPALAAEFSWPQAVTVDGKGDLYIGGHDGRIRKVTPDGIVSTFAGETSTYFNDGGQAISVGFTSYVNSVLPAKGGGFFVTAGTQVFKVSPVGVISIVAGTGNSGVAGDGGPAVNADLLFPYGTAQDAAGNLYVTDDVRIRKIDTNGIITTVAGNGTAGFSGDGGPALSAELQDPLGLVFDASGNLYIADSQNHEVRMVNPQGIITTFAGNGQDGSAGDGGPAKAAELSAPNSLAIDAGGNLYIVDAKSCWEVNCPYGAGGGERVRKVDPNGVITTFAGNGMGDYTGDGGPAIDASLCFPVGITVDADGNVLILDGGNDVVRKVDSTGTISTVELLFGSGVSPLNLSVDDYSKAGGGIGADAEGNLYIANYFDSVVLKGTKITGTYVDSAVNAADYEAGVSPGSLVTLLGLNLADQKFDLAPPLANSAGDTTVTLGGLAVPLLYVSPTQINLQIPFEAPLGMDTLTIARSSTGTATVPLQVTAASPGIFRTAGQGAITNVDGRLSAVAGVGVPAAPGSYIQIWCTGLGAVTNPPASGSAAPSGPPYSQTIETPSVTIGGAAAPVQFSGLAPGFVGLYQINVQVPADAPAGDAVPVTVSIGNAADTVTVAIAAQ